MYYCIGSYRMYLLFAPHNPRVENFIGTFDHVMLTITPVSDRDRRCRKIVPRFR